MKTIITTLTAAIISLSALTANAQNSSTTPTTDANGNTYLVYKPQNKTFVVNGVSFTMVEVRGGTFTMGATREQGSDAESDEMPTHKVTLSSYYIGQTEVTQELWKAVMSINPSCHQGNNYPVENVSWNEVQTFISKLNNITGLKFRLPTEAEWEFAARGGTMSNNGYKYSGDRFAGCVAWYDDFSEGKTHPVALKEKNRLGIYDMSGNVWEWCQDWYDDYSRTSQTNPTGPSSGSCRVFRGGGYGSPERDCRVSCRSTNYPYYRHRSLGFRIAISNISDKDVSHRYGVSTDLKNKKTQNFYTPHNKTFTVNGVSFSMVEVRGGTFNMGAPIDQGNDASPVHKVTLSSYYIGQTEVTQALWQAVMGNNPSYHKGNNYPVENVSWKTVQTFISKLNSITGLNFRLPTEAEWEFAARGGIMSKGYKYSGDDIISFVAWYDDNSGDETHIVGTKTPNELGIYDMSGNVLEWCQDWCDVYTSAAQTNPTGPSSGYGRVVRGGSYGSPTYFCRVPDRGYYRGVGKHLGFRLAL